MTLTRSLLTQKYLFKTVYALILFKYNINIVAKMNFSFTFIIKYNFTYVISDI